MGRITSALAQLAVMSADNERLRNAIVAHPALAESLRVSTPESFKDPAMLATWLRACGKLRLEIPRLKAYVDRAMEVLDGPKATPANVMVLAEALAAVRYRDLSPYRAIAEHLRKHARAFSVKVRCPLLIPSIVHCWSHCMCLVGLGKPMCSLASRVRCANRTRTLLM